MAKNRSKQIRKLDLISVVSEGKLSAYSDYLCEVYYVRSGGSAQGIHSLASSLDWEIKYIAKVLGTTSRSLKAKCSKRMNQQISESSLDIARLSNFAVEYFGNIDEWNKWLNSPHIQLGYQPPRDLMGSIIGRRLIKQIINRLRYSFMA